MSRINRYPLKFIAVDTSVIELVRESKSQEILEYLNLTDYFEIEDYVPSLRQGISTSYITLKSGQSIYLRCKYPSFKRFELYDDLDPQFIEHASSYIRFNIQGLIKLKGSMADLFTPDWNTFGNDERYYPRLFMNCDILNTPHFERYQNIDKNGLFETFRNCKYLMESDDLMGPSINFRSYEGTFMNCENLIKPPIIGADKYFSSVSCHRMFKGCRSLKTVPQFRMFENPVDISKITETFSNIFEDCPLLE